MAGSTAASTVMGSSLAGPERLRTEAMLLAPGKLQVRHALDKQAARYHAPMLQLPQHGEQLIPAERREMLRRTPWIRCRSCPANAASSTKPSRQSELTERSAAAPSALSSAPRSRTPFRRRPDRRQPAGRRCRGTRLAICKRAVQYQRPRPEPVLAAACLWSSSCRRSGANWSLETRPSQTRSSRSASSSEGSLP